ncbi:MAG TPA: 30S ribosomal protein S13 [Thermoplasmata archaeon]|nr:30S ribosomal protein S13 [Thermoplasmata archaeon]
MSTAPKESPETKPDEAARAADAGADAPTEKSSKKEKGAKGKDSKEPKEGKEGGKKAKAAAPGAGKAAKYVPDNPNFRYIVRVSNSDLDGTRPTALALTGVRGVGLRLAEVACRLADVKASERIGNLPEATVESIEATLGSLPTKVPEWMINHRHEPADGATVHYIGPDLETRRRDDMNQMKMIRSYRGVRHERGQKVRGQRTRSNGRTGMAAGVLKKAAKEAASAAGKEAAPAAPAAPKAEAAAKTPAKKE